jgi:hypothetical protein
MTAIYKGECFCGTVHVEASGEPEAMGYCHCRSCRSWSGGPVNAFTLWKPGAVRITAGAEYVGMFQKTALSQRQYCENAAPTLWPITRHLGWWTYSRRHCRRCGSAPVFT